jgi:hypothetical protein
VKISKFVLFVFVSVFGSFLFYQQANAANKEEKKVWIVNYLFSYDNCKVYRFFDKGEYRYFSFCRG